MIKDNSPFWFLFYDKQLLCVRDKKGDEALLRGETMPFSGRHETSGLVHALGVYDGAACFAHSLDSLPPETEGPCIPVDLRASYEVLGEPLYELAGKASELIHWDKHTRFCPACGAPTTPKQPTSKICPVCDNEIFPNIAVACIVLVMKKDSILMVRSHVRRKNYGLVAGFLEPGETLEQCVTREVREETGLEIEDIRYFGSQPWPYPSGIMAAFLADYKSGEITIQAEELSDAAFFTRDNLPPLPASLSVARKLVDWWLLEKSGP